jgi:predicted membrane-bound mannosyltransferase
VAVLLLAGAAHLGWQAYRAAFVYPAAPRNPYVYAHTSSAFLRLVERIRDLDDVYPPREDMPVYVIDPIGDYWPLPWYLRDMDNVGFWNKAPDRLHGVPVIVTDKMGLPQLDEDEGYTWEMHGLRPGKLLRVYIDKQLWERFIERRR